MDGIDTLYTWTNGILWYALIVLRAWAFVDCLTRKAAAFTAADKLTKPSWLLILVAAGLLGTLAGPPLWPMCARRYGRSPAVTDGHSQTWSCLLLSAC